MPKYLILDHKGLIEDHTDEDEARTRFDAMQHGEDGGWEEGDLVLAQVLEVRH